MDARPEAEPADASEEAAEAARALAELIADFRAEVYDSVRKGVENELAQLEADGFDPARGRGRGPHWIKDG